MRYLFLSIFTLFLSAGLKSQDSLLTALETSLPSLQGADYVSQALEISRLYFADGNAHKTQSFSQKALDISQSIGDDEGRAEALYLKGQGLMLVRPQRTQYRVRANRIFKEAFFLTSDRDLKIEIMEAERVLALARNRTKEVKILDVLLATLKGELTPDQAAANPLFSSHKRSKNILRAVASENIELNKQVDSLEQQQVEMELAQAEALAEKEDEIMSMSEAAAKAELISTQRKRLLDSLQNDALIKAMKLEKQEMLLETQETQLALQQSELDLKTSRNRFFIALAGIIFLIAFGLLSRFLAIRNYNRTLKEKNSIIAKEQKRSEGLLLNILPAPVAKELKEKGAAKARHYDQVTVLFVDFKNFSKIASILTPGELVDDLDFCFRHFDQIVQEYGLEKIKTIGDAYMCAGGLPDPNPDQARSVIGAAFAMQTFLKDWRDERIGTPRPIFEARMGIHTGPIVAGVVGSKKFAYDIWGDTVNIASRMESNSEAGKVNISAATAEMLNGSYQLQARGKIAAKNVGEIEMFFVEEKASSGK